MSERDYEELKKLPRHATLMEWDKSFLACHSMKYQSLCGELTVELEALKTREAALIKAIQLGIGFCVDFRQNKDWENHPEIGVLFAKLKIALKNNPKRD